MIQKSYYIQMGIKEHIEKDGFILLLRLNSIEPTLSIQLGWNWNKLSL